MPDRTSRRERRHACRRKEILAAAARVFATKGYRDATVSEIAAALDMADGTLYNYFASKRDLLLAILDKASTDVQVLVSLPHVPRTRKDLVSTLVSAYAVLVDHLPFVRTLLMEAWADDAILQHYLAQQLAHIRQPIAAYIRARIEAGDFCPVDPLLATQMVLGMVAAPIVSVLRGTALPPSPEQRQLYAETAIDILMDGVRVRAEQ